MCVEQKMDNRGWCLCCVGSCPFGAWIFAAVVTTMGTFIHAGRSMRLLGAAEPGSVFVAPFGFYMLYQLRKEKRVPRGCGFCTCPFPAWALVCQALDLLGMAMLMVVEASHSEPAHDEHHDRLLQPRSREDRVRDKSGGRDKDDEGMEWLFWVMLLVHICAVAMDVALGSWWLKSLMDQDGDCCCGVGRYGGNAPAVVASSGYGVTVIGTPVQVSQGGKTAS
eukprot:TRINITY_DN122954_c0_g1_i1.p1 TRINITY_DN122954_c0_g1~~TRINITY_DN122954_c0_g1_i1.p1  ORF type:complete len:222 (-),score=28.84 TRINITY_DN122954_c0_g1_i1:181-846(-)